MGRPSTPVTADQQRLIDIVTEAADEYREARAEAQLAPARVTAQIAEERHALALRLVVDVAEVKAASKAAVAKADAKRAEAIRAAVDGGVVRWALMRSDDKGPRLDKAVVNEALARTEAAA